MPGKRISSTAVRNVSTPWRVPQAPRRRGQGGGASHGHPGRERTGVLAPTARIKSGFHVGGVDLEVDGRLGGQIEDGASVSATTAAPTLWRPSDGASPRRQLDLVRPLRRGSAEPPGGRPEDPGRIRRRPRSRLDRAGGIPDASGEGHDSVSKASCYNPTTAPRAEGFVGRQLLPYHAAVMRVPVGTERIHTRGGPGPSIGSSPRRGASSPGAAAGRRDQQHMDALRSPCGNVHWSARSRHVLVVLKAPDHPQRRLSALSAPDVSISSAASGPRSARRLPAPTPFTKDASRLRDFIALLPQEARRQRVPSRVVVRRAGPH
jgi:hypothetical protein